ncbi:MAG TPA: hypothetical protein VEL11_08105 [Candidatus Bathyarchaeia archaeon]|nr:hypothetical protein [Candidatus Bathyarchaeia archaeon]
MNHSLSETLYQTYLPKSEPYLIHDLLRDLKKNSPHSPDIYGRLRDRGLLPVTGRGIGSIIVILLSVQTGRGEDKSFDSLSYP